MHLRPDELVALEDGLAAQELLDQLDIEAEDRRTRGDPLGAGEVYATLLTLVDDAYHSECLAQAIAGWASTSTFAVAPESIPGLVARINDFDHRFLAIGTVTAFARLLGGRIDVDVTDLTYRLLPVIRELYHTTAERPEDVAQQAIAAWQARWTDLIHAADVLTTTSGATSKRASIEFLKAVHRYKNTSLVGERRLLSQVDILLGAAYRKFCEACERKDEADIASRLPDVRRAAQQFLSVGRDTHSYLWSRVLAKVGEHVITIANEADSATKAAITPDLGVSNELLKADLTQQPLILHCTLENSGAGRANQVRVRGGREFSGEVQIQAPQAPFDLGSGERQLITLEIELPRVYRKGRASVPLLWTAETITGVPVEQPDTINIKQQVAAPDWDALVRSEPYSLKPVNSREKLYGREATLRDLFVSAASGNSMFLWGQKRVGKTSVVQVLRADLNSRSGYSCQLFRMGELKAMHEGQVAARIAGWLHTTSGTTERLPSEREFGAGMARLVPFAESVQQEFPRSRFVIIIDEFDDIDPAFYLGERGGLFIKALRSLSEVGLVFFLVGSEKLASIQQRHATELNKWTTHYLDHLDSIEDCKSLIEDPVRDAIEYETAAVDQIIDSCGKNPFYMHFVCDELFRKCYSDQRTYVSAAEAEAAGAAVVAKAGVHNFSHFWEDNPVIDLGERAKLSAENALVLASLVHGGEVRDQYEVASAQAKLGLNDGEFLSPARSATALRRLTKRRVVTKGVDGTQKILLPLFEDWLSKNSEVVLVPLWRDYLNREGEDRSKSRGPVPILDQSFPISEDDLLPVSKQLEYLGKQKDVAEIRAWLRQFDDDVRIEIAFNLLRRLAEAGFVNEGMRIRRVSELIDALYDKRKELGKGVWREFRRRRDNLCITYIDAEHKSGGTTARLFRQRTSPGKVAIASAIGPWVESRIDQDPIVLVVDDFVGSGTTMEKGLKRILGEYSASSAFSRLLEEGRLLCYVLYGLPEGLHRIREGFPQINIVIGHVFGPEVRPLDPESELFEEDELEFVTDVLLQVGRELTPNMPLGWEDIAALVAFNDSVPNDTLPIFWSSGTVGERPWAPLFQRP